MKPWRTRKGSTTDSIVSGLLTNGYRITSPKPHRPAVKANDKCFKNCSVQPVQAQLVDVVKL